MKILMVLTSHDQLGNTGKKTGFWLEEFAAPYYTFKDAGAQLTLVSPKGGQPHRWTPKVMSQTRRPRPPIAFARIPLPSLH
jgi:putative intracellular protease/amidase